MKERSTPWIVFKDSVNYAKPRYVDVRYSIKGITHLVVENQRKWKERWFAWAPLTGSLLYIQSEQLQRDTVANEKRFNQLKACVPSHEWRKYVEGGDTEEKKKKPKKKKLPTSHPSNPFDLLADP